jgi:hypothetical protein
MSDKATGKHVNADIGNASQKHTPQSGGGGEGSLHGATARSLMPEAANSINDLIYGLSGDCRCQRSEFE